MEIAYVVFFVFTFVVDNNFAVSKLSFLLVYLASWRNACPIKLHSKQLRSFVARETFGVSRYFADAFLLRRVRSRLLS